jgi:peptidoglycan hydrolase-like protein with peptidoglycan-binding domain
LIEGGAVRRTLAGVVAIVAALTLATGCEQGGTEPDPPPVAVPTSSTPSATPSPTPSASRPPTAPSKPAAPAMLRNGDKSAEVKALQDRLTALGYWNGKADGEFGSLTRQAVFALQKAAGLSRDGVVGPKTRRALDRGVRPKAKSSTGLVVEINLRRQLLLLVDKGQVRTILNTSTGSNQYYEYEGERYLAVTPRGRFRASRQIDGWRHGPLGDLWRPKYFNGGIAVHGAYSVPPYPASHGCARVSIPAMNWIWANNKLPLKTRVWVY